MDENGARALLAQVADDPLPPIRVSVQQAARDGRHKLRWRRVYLPGAAPIAAAAAVALIVGLLTVTGTGLRQGTAPNAAARLQAVPDRFSALVPYASFGWLPAGYTPDGLANQTLQTTTQLQINASASGGRSLSVIVYPARVCKITGRYVRGSGTGRRETAAAHGLSCSNELGPWPLIRRAADVSGGLAYWSQGQSLAWQYGRNAWALLTLLSSACHRGSCRTPEVPAQPSGPTSALMHKVASSIRYGTNHVVRYGVTISGLPASWLVARTNTIDSVATIDGVLANVAWQAGPADDPEALTVHFAPASSRPQVCGFGPSKSGAIVLDGVRAGLGTFGSHGHEYEQDLCALDVHGVQVQILLDLSTQGARWRPLPGDSQVGDMQRLLRHLRLLGPDPTRWGTQPTR